MACLSGMTTEVTQKHVSESSPCIIVTALHEEWLVWELITVILGLKRSRRVADINIITRSSGKN
jgi:hypothetical protein